MDIEAPVLTFLSCGLCRMYAENVRMRLQSSGMSTELVPVRGGGMDMNAALASAVQDAVRRHALFACIINEQNEMHRSMTVNILHGQLQGGYYLVFILFRSCPTRGDFQPAECVIFSITE